MEKQPHTVGRTFRRGLVGLVLALGLGLVSAGAQTVGLSLSLANDRYTIGQRLTVDLLAENAEPGAVKLLQPVYPAALALLAVEQRSSTWEKVPGVMAKGTRFSLTFRVAKAGIVPLGPFQITWDGGSAAAPARTLFLLREDEAQKRYPLEVRWVLPPGPYYRGQDLPLILKVGNLQNLLKPVPFDLPAPGNGILERVTGLGDIEITTVGDDRLFNIPWGSWMLLPNSSGTLNLPQVEFSVGGLTRSTPGDSLTILPLPAEVETTRAVGDFTWSASASRGTGSEAGLLVVRFELKGRGNFPYLRLPAFEPAGFQKLGTQEGNGYQATSSGYQGSLSQTLRLTPVSGGRHELVLPGFTWFNPALQKVVSTAEQTVSIDFAAPGAPAPAASSSQKLLDWEAVLAARSWGLSSGWAWLALLPGLAVGAWLALRKTGSKTGKAGKAAAVLVVLVLLGAAVPVPPAFQAAWSASQSGDPAAALPLWGAFLKENPREPGAWYNQGQLQEQLGQTAQAVYSYRQALRLGFSGPAAAQALHDLEARANILDQAGTWTGLWLDGLFLAFLLAANTAFVLFGLTLRRRKAGLVISTVLVGALALSLLSTSLGAQWQNDLATAILGPDNPALKRVPGDLAEEWMTLKAGTPVKVIGSAGEYALVRTTYGLEGWVHHDAVLNLQ